MEILQLSDFPELLKPDVKIKEIKKIIKEKTGIIETNQRFHVYFDYKILIIFKTKSYYGKKFLEKWCENNNEYI